jgi:alkaline phosphatase D
MPTRFLFASSRCAAAAICVVAQVTLAIVTRGQVLTHGPVVGGVTASEAKVFARTGDASTVVLEYGTDPGLQDLLVSETFQTRRESDFTTIIPVVNLQAETTYYLNLLVNGVSQNAPPYPSFTTFPPAGSSRNFEFVVLSDFSQVRLLTADVKTFASAAAEVPAFAFIGGDFDHRNPQTLAERRQMFKELYDPTTPYMSGFVPLILNQTPVVHQWDDHDVGLNNVDRTYIGWHLAYQAFQEYVPSYPLPSARPGTWQKFSYAQADCFVLDCRSQRDPDADPDGPDKSMLDGANLGATGELQWLEDGLTNSNARWKIIFSSVITNPSTKVDDGWGAYNTEWNALRSFITTNNIPGVVFVSGDLHLGAIDDGRQAGFPEMCVPAANMPSMESCATAPNGNWSEGYYDGDCAGYGLVSVLQNPDRLILQVVDQFGVVQVAYTVGGSLPPAIVSQPADEAVRVGEPVRFSVTASGTPPLRYQWRKNGAKISGATKALYITPPTSLADNGLRFSVLVSNVAGRVISSEAILTVRSRP